VTVTLNCDLGELADTALEAALMEHITWANVACGAHAGDEDTMERTIRLALAHGVQVGAHPGYPDRANFGRVVLPMTGDEIAATVEEQLQRLDAIARRLGARVRHVKPHGALYNLAAKDRSVALAVARGVGQWRADVTLVGLAGSVMLEAWREEGFAVAAEGFADRAYDAGGTLRPRSQPGALIIDPAEAALQAVRLMRSTDTICIHGDTPGAPAIAAAVARALAGFGEPFAGTVT
jgi:UPF0271 protein